MAMRLVRDEPDVELDEVRSDSAHQEATVLHDLRRVPTVDPNAILLGRGLGKNALKARLRMSSKSQVIEVHEFGTDAEDDTAAHLGAAEPSTPLEETDGTAADRADDAGPAIDVLAADASAASDELTDGAVVVDASATEQPADEGEGADTSSVAAEVSLPTLEALLLATHHPLTAAKLNELMGVSSAKAIRQAVRALNESYEETGRCFRIEQVAGGYQILTLPEFGDALKRLHQKEADAKLTKAALETLSIVAYKQPILRADVEAIRGVACGETIRSLMEKHLVKIAGRAEMPGRPILYGTTKRFLELFGLNSLKDLPKPEEFKAVAAE